MKMSMVKIFLVSFLALSPALFLGGCSKQSAAERDTHVPSGSAPPYLRLSRQLRTDEQALELKRRLAQEFAESHKDNELSGFWFLLTKNDEEYVTVYCPQYDSFLNDNYIRHSEQKTSGA